MTTENEDSIIDEALAILRAVYITSLAHSALSARIAASITAMDGLNKARSAAKSKPVDIKLSEIVRSSSEAVKIYETMLKEKGGSMVVEDDIKSFNPWLNNLTTETKKQLHEIFDKSKTESWSSAKIKEELGKIEHFGKNVRAKTAAFCETRVQQDEATRKLWTYGGLEMVQWHTMEDNRVRPKHVERNHRVYKINESPSLGEPNCRCYLSPYIVKDNWSPDYTAKERGYHPKQIKIQDSIIQPIVRKETGIQASKAVKIGKPTAEIVRTKDDVKKIINDFESSIKDNEIEHGGVFSKSGNLIIKKTGEADHISWSREERSVMQGTKVTHNHPGGAGFSPDDIDFACNNGLNEIRAVGANRSYSMYFADGRDFTPDDWKKIEDRYNRTYPIGVAKIRNEFKGIEWDTKKATEKVMNYTWSRTVKEIDGLVYKVDVVK